MQHIFSNCSILLNTTGFKQYFFLFRIFLLLKLFYVSFLVRLIQFNLLMKTTCGAAQHMKPQHLQSWIALILLFKFMHTSMKVSSDNIFEKVCKMFFWMKKKAVNQLLFPPTLFCDFLELNWIATNFRDQAFSRPLW